MSIGRRQRTDRCAEREQVDGLRLPQLKDCAFSRKNGRFSAKNSGNLVRLTLLFVGFDLREVGDREIQREIGAHTPLGIQARRLPGDSPPDGSVWSSVIEAGHIRQESHVTARRQAQPLQLAGHRDAIQGVAARHG